MEKKLTQREVLQAVIDEKVTEIVIERAKELIQQLDNRNEKRKDKKAEIRNEENEPLIIKMLEFMETVKDDKGNHDYVLAKQVGEALGVSPQKATPLLKIAVERGQVESLEPTSRSKPYQYKLAS